MIAPATEPTSTALLLVALGALLGASILFSRASQRIGVPVALLFLAVGILGGTEGIGGIPFEDYELAFRLGTVALVLILFDGGLNTPLASLRLVLAPAAVLATVGVVATAAIVAAASRALGLGWSQALLLGAVVSSTDAAAVFSVLRGSGVQLKRRVGVTLEVESGINDPMAVLLTTVLTHNVVAGGRHGAADEMWWRAAAEVVGSMAVGGVLGLALGYGGRLLLARVRLPAGGLYPALTLALALLTFAIPTLLHGSGFLAVYVAAVVLGNGALPYRTGLLRVHDALAWLSQIAMFLVLGLLVFPSRLWGVAALGLGVALVLAFVARPLAVALCLLPFRYSVRETAYVGWVGLRGAVPIILATIPVLAGAPGAERLFDIVFFVVVAHALVPGATVRRVTAWLRLGAQEPPPPAAVIEINSMQPLRGDLMSFYIDPALAVAGLPIAELPFPDGSAVTLVVRGEELVAPRGSTVLTPGDHVYVFSRPEDRTFIQLMFGRPEGG